MIIRLAISQNIFYLQAESTRCFWAMCFKMFIIIFPACHKLNVLSRNVLRRGQDGLTFSLQLMFARLATVRSFLP